jgi:peptide/nickel transport system substrate-binding protein
VGTMRLQPSRREFLGRVGGGLAAAAVAGPLLAACSTSTSSTPAAGAGSSSGGARRGGTLRFAVAGGAASDTPDPALAGTSFTLYLAANLYDTLVRADQDFVLTPMLATAWSSTPDAKTWTFRLRDGVTFHDGSKLTSKDVAYSIGRILQPKLASPGLSNLSPFLQTSGISTPDATTVKFALSAPNAFFPQIFAGSNFGIVKDGTTSFASPAGTGPFSLQEFQPLANAKLVRNADYWRGQLPYLDGVNLVSVAEDSTRLQSLIGGSEDLVDNVTGADVKLLAAQPSVQTLQIKAGGWVDLAAWADTSPFSSPEVTLAMKYAADREQIMSVVAPNSYLTGPDIPVPESDPFYPQGLKAYPYDPAYAKHLLQKAGYRDGLSLTLYAYEGDKLDAALAYKQTAKPAGININVVTWPHATYWTQVWLKKPFVGDSWARLHTSVILQEAFSAQPNEFHWKSDKFDNLLSSAVASTDTARQKVLYGDALTMLNDSVSGIIPGWEPQLYGASATLQGVELANGGQVFLDSAYFA